MATIVGGFASSHSPLMSLPGEDWNKRADDDTRNRELIRPRDGAHVTYAELLESADPKIAEQIDEQVFCRKYAALQQGLNELGRSFAQTDPDVVVMFGDDQDELFFDDNYPMISLYWGETFTHLPRLVARPGMSEALKISFAVYGTEVIEYPVETKLGLHLVEQLVERDFDIAQSRYMKAEYGGTIGPGTWYLNYQRTTAPRKQGMSHAFAFPICRWFMGKRPPIVPITINTCYPPNWISPRRAFSLGRAVREAILNWDSDARVAVVTSGGLSHFTVDEEIDSMALKGLCQADGDILSSLPRCGRQAATTEILNWVAAAGAMGETPMELLTYQAGYRSPAGTGCGCAVGRWTP
jgi:catalytic LigB subunit of aromatic ring-opening dioxygenase